MIWTLATPGRAIAVRAWSQVSTLTPYPAMAFSATRVSRPSKTSSEEKTAVGGQCSWTRSRVSMPRLARERSVHCRKLARVYASGALLDAAAHLGGDGEPGVGSGAQEAADQLLAAAVAVHVGGVEEGDSGVHGGGEHRHRVVLADGAPVGAELPGAQADRADGPAEPVEAALFHAPSLVIGLPALPREPYG